MDPLERFGFVEPAEIEVPDPAVTRKAVSSAWVCMSQAFDVDWSELCRTIGLSRSTMSNYGSGKTQAKCSRDQAVVLAAVCRERAETLLLAAEIFEKVV